MRAVIVGMTMVLVGCASYDRFYTTQFTPISDHRFIYRALEISVYSHETRISWMEEDLANNNFCPDGYEIERMDRNVRTGSAGDLIVHGRCLDAPSRQDL